jgi:hypothetical protein
VTSRLPWAIPAAAIEQVAWRTAEILPSPRGTFSAEALEKQIANKAESVAGRSRPAYALAWLRRLERKLPLVISSLHVNQIRMLHLPGGCFVEYQLRAQQLQPSRFVATAAYGDVPRHRRFADARHGAGPGIRAGLFRTRSNSQPVPIGRNQSRTEFIRSERSSRLERSEFRSTAYYRDQAIRFCSSSRA